MSDSETKINLRRLPADQVFSFDIEPDAAQRQEIGALLELLVLRKLRFKGTMAPAGKRDWALNASLGATVVQPCVVTLAPVTTRIDDTVTRLYLSRISEAEEGSETEMPEDDSVEPVPETLDLVEVMTEALALSLPLYPKAEGAVIETGNFAPPGVAPMTDEETKPFAGLAALRDKLAKDGEND